MCVVLDSTTEISRVLLTVMRSWRDNSNTAFKSKGASLANPRTIRVHIEGGYVLVERSDGYRRVWQDVIGIVRNRRGGRKIIAVGDSREELRKVPLPTGEESSHRAILESAEFRTAFDLSYFDPEVASAFLSYAIMSAQMELPWWRRLWKPLLFIEFPGFETLPDSARIAFEDHMRTQGRSTLINDKTARAAP